MLRSQQRTAWLIISTGMFTSFLFEPSFGVVDLRQNTVHALGSWNTAVTVTTPEDIGMLTAEILSAEPPIVNQIIYTAGDTLNYKQLADVVEKTLGRQFQRVEWTVPFLRAELARDPGDSIRKYRLVFAESGGVAWDKSTTFNGRRSIPVTDVESWVRTNLR